MFDLAFFELADVKQAEGGEEEEENLSILL